MISHANHRLACFFFCFSVPVADLGGGALGASAPPAESMVKKNLFSSQCTVGTFLCSVSPVLKSAPLRFKQLLIVTPYHKIKVSQSVESKSADHLRNQAT